MNSITLTELHKSKLLEMCKKLFPVYEKIKIVDSNFGKDIVYIKFEGKGNYQYIHWFEFCMTYLVNKIPTARLLSLALRAEKSCGLSENNYRENHPVDFLYEEFQKLK